MNEYHAPLSLEYGRIQQFRRNDPWLCASDNFTGKKWEKMSRVLVRPDQSGFRRLFHEQSCRHSFKQHISDKMWFRFVMENSNEADRSLVSYLAQVFHGNPTANPYEAVFHTSENPGSSSPTSGGPPKRFEADGLLNLFICIHLFIFKWTGCYFRWDYRAFSRTCVTHEWEQQCPHKLRRQTNVIAWLRFLLFRLYRH